MKLETFFEKFDRFADAPDGVDELRKIILHLAVRGSLVEQSDDDEPASAMLQRLGDRKPSLLDSAGLPKSWARVALGDLLELQKGKKPSSLNTEGVGLPYLDIAALERGELREFTEDDKCPRAVSGDLVIVCDGSRSGLVLDGAVGVLGSTVSKVGYAGFVRDYLKLFLRSLYDDLNGAKKGAAIPHLNIPRFLAIPAPVPSLAEQKRVVTKVDELMALCDRLEAQQQERVTRHAALARASLSRFADAHTTANLNFIFHPSYAITPADLRKSILTLAVQGKLVTQDPNDGDAREVIDRAMKKRQQTIQSKNLRRKALDESEELISEEELPASWCVERFANLVDPENTISYGVLVPGSDVASGIPFVRVQDLSIKSAAKLPNKTIAPEIEKPYARTRLRGGEILLCVVGATIGRLGVAPASWAGANIARAVARIAPIAEVNRDYLLLVLRSPLIQSYFAATTRTLAQPTLNVGAIEQAPIPLPPHAEQRRIVAKVDQLMALVDALEAQLAASRATAANLLLALVAELTGTTSAGKVFPRSGSATGLRGRPRKSTG